MAIDIKGLAKSAIGQGFALAAQIVSPFNYCQPAAQAYDTATGTMTGTPTKTAIKGMVLSFKASEIDGNNVKQGDQRILVEATQLAARPSMDDFFEPSDQVAAENRLQIQNWKLEPTLNLYKFHVRKAGG